MTDKTLICYNIFYKAIGGKLILMKTDMTKGDPLKLILMFAVPLFMSNLFQQIYNISDTAIVGHILGDQALSSMGAVSSLYGLIMSLCLGMTSGFSLLTARYFGANDEKNLKRSIAATTVLSGGFTIILTLISVLFLKTFLHWLHTPDDIFENSYRYISIIVSCCIVTVFYNMLSGIMRALGNSLVPLIFLIISSVMNIGLDILFMMPLGFGVAGAAFATVLAQLISGILCLLYIIRKCPQIHIHKEDFSFTGAFIKEMFLTGLAMSMMMAVVNTGTVILQSGINNLGSAMIAGHTAARKISEIFMMAGSTLSATMSTFTSQNYGAGKIRRVWQGVKITHILGWIWSTMLLIITFLFADAIISGLTGSSNPEILHTGARYLRINVPFYYVLFILCILRNTLQGLGVKLWPVIGSVLEMLGKFLTVIVFIPMFGYTAVCFCEPATWIICSVMVTVVFFMHPEIRKIFKKDEKQEEKTEKEEIISI